MEEAEEPSAEEKENRRVKLPLHTLHPPLEPLFQRIVSAAGAIIQRIATRRRR